MDRARDSLEQRPEPADPGRLIGPDGRIDSQAYRADYPPLPAGRGHYLRPPPGAAMPVSSVHVGSVIDGYRVRRQIGRGGMGVVYEAEQLALGRTVALKVMPPGMVRNARNVERFRGEATAVARLSHPRIVAVHGFNVSDDGVAWLAMEYVEGLDLAEIIDRLKAARTHGRRFVRISGPDLDQDITEWAQGRKLMGTMPGDPRIRDGIVIDLRNPFPMLAAIAADVADALRHAHAHGVVHRDIKPSNLILSREGRVKLSDFGLAKSADAGTLTETGDLVGSPAYVSPEQASSRRARVDERSDLYSLGVTLYELLTLHQPFVGKNVAVVLRNILTLDPPPPSKLNPRIPRDLETIALKAIERDPDRRYQSAEEFGDDLRRFLNFEPITARPLGPLARGLRNVRRHRVPVALGVMASLVVALAAALTSGWVGNGRGDDLLLDVERYLAARGGTRLDAEQIVRQLSVEVSPAERRAHIEQLALDAGRRLTKDEFDEVAALLGQMDAGVELGRWSELERRFAEASVRGVKIEFVRRVRGALRSGSAVRIDAATRRQWLAYLEDLLVDPDWQVAKNAAVALGELARPSSLGALLDALRSRQDVPGKLALIAALRRFGHGAAVPLLAAEIQHPDEWVRLAVLDALEALDPPDLEALVAPLAGDRIAWVRHGYDGVVARHRRELPP